MLETLKNLDHAVEALRTIIRAKGADYVYEKPGKGKDDGACRYTLPVEGFGQIIINDSGEDFETDVIVPPTEAIVGSCVMGILIMAENPDMAPVLFQMDENGGESISAALYEHFGWKYVADYDTDFRPTDQIKASVLFGNMQGNQDRGDSWGVSFHRAIVDLNTSYGTNYNPDVNSASIHKED